MCVCEWSEKGEVAPVMHVYLYICRWAGVCFDGDRAWGSLLWKPRQKAGFWPLDIDEERRREGVVVGVLLVCGCCFQSEVDGPCVEGSKMESMKWQTKREQAQSKDLVVNNMTPYIEDKGKAKRQSNKGGKRQQQKAKGVTPLWLT